MPDTFWRSNMASDYPTIGETVTWQVLDFQRPDADDPAHPLYPTGHEMVVTSFGGPDGPFPVVRITGNSGPVFSDRTGQPRAW